MAPVIEIHGLRTAFGAHVVHEDLDLSVEAGDILALVGGSGSGKTTLLRHMLGLTRPQRGSVHVFGEEIGRLNSRRLQQVRNRWGMLFQHGALFSALTALENVMLPLQELRTLPAPLVREAALLKLAMVGISASDAQKMPADLSGGMVKRVALARALALEPELLFLDEPTAGLDPSLSDSFVALIRSLHEHMRLTVVMVTHDLDTLFALATKVAVLADRRVIACDAPHRVLEVEHPFITHFFLGERGKRALQEVRDTESEHGK
ncbi:MAG TPA: ATP-binding cassette domain-containing protein [Noviherbaspirillum sp.]|nr:ATP-binding cassette domain-containing protein [Noviherbaspirillum sp.]